MLFVVDNMVIFFKHLTERCVIENQHGETCRLLRERFHVVLCMPKLCNLFILMGDTKKTYS